MNYTPLDIISFQKKREMIPMSSLKSFDMYAIFLSLVVITLAMMAILLYILIQRKLQELAYVPFFA